MNSQGIFKSSEVLPMVMPPDENESEKLRLLGLAKTVRLLSVTDIALNFVYMFYLVLGSGRYVKMIWEG